MKIGITCYPTYGGSGVVATELGKKLAELGHQIHFISYALPYRLNKFTSNIFFHEVEVVEYPLFTYPPYEISLASKMYEIAKYKKLDLLHVHYAIPHATSAFLARQLLTKPDLKIITTLHGTDITLLGTVPSLLPITKFSIEQSSGITAVSHFLKNMTCKLFHITKEITVIPNFIPFDEHGPLKNKNNLRRNFADKDECIITHISNFRPPKRVIDIVPIIKLVRKKLKVKMIMIGDGPDRYKVEEQCRAENLCDKFHFLGKQQNIYNILAITDLFLTPSSSESFGLAVLEAMAFGIPCVTSNAGGLPEVNINGLSGYTIQVGDINGYSEAIVNILSNRKVKREMGVQAKEIAYDKFSHKKIIPEYINFYQRILSEK
jgi:N-acetyl-alpha-D-glucosaminyl L-malate synthase BshA